MLDRRNFIQLGTLSFLASLVPFKFFPEVNIKISLPEQIESIREYSESAYNLDLASIMFMEQDILTSLFYRNEKRITPDHLKYLARVRNSKISKLKKSEGPVQDELIGDISGHNTLKKQFENHNIFFDSYFPTSLVSLVDIIKLSKEDSRDSRLDIVNGAVSFYLAKIVHSSHVQNNDFSELGMEPVIYKKILTDPDLLFSEPVKTFDDFFFGKNDEMAWMVNGEAISNRSGIRKYVDKIFGNVYELKSKKLEALDIYIVNDWITRKDNDLTSAFDLGVEEVESVLVDHHEPMHGRKVESKHGEIPCLVAETLSQSLVGYRSIISLLGSKNEQYQGIARNVIKLFSDVGFDVNRSFDYSDSVRKKSTYDVMKKII